MQFSTLFTLALSSLSSLSAAVPLQQRADPPSLTWHVSNFTTGCSPGGCTYDFNILGIETKNTPGFNTTCTGTDLQKDYAPCKDRHVQAQLIPQTYPNWTLKVQHMWLEGQGAEYWSRGSKNVTSNEKSFAIPVASSVGVA